MKIKTQNIYINLFAFSVVLYFIQKTVFWIFKTKTNSFVYSVEILNFIFFGFSILILIILSKVKQKNIDIVGMTFLLITTIKMLLCYGILFPILYSNNQNKIEKINFFILFALFLTAETTLTIKLLDKKN
jgi:hypothetical protein